MPNVMIQWAQHYGGTLVEEFEQNSYIKNFKAELKGGCCMALCSCWMVCKGNVGTFRMFIKSKIGMNQVKGFQGLAVAAAGPASALGGYFTGYIRAIWSVFGIRDDAATATGIARDASAVRTFVSKDAGYYQLHFQAADGSSGHAIAFRNTGTALELFDPNYGMVSFGGAQRAGNLDNFLRKLLTGFYPGLNGRWECVRGQFP